MILQIEICHWLELKIPATLLKQRLEKSHRCFQIKIKSEIQVFRTNPILVYIDHLRDIHIPRPIQIKD